MHINRDSVNPNDASTSTKDLRAFPLNPDGTYKLETQLRSSIHESQLEGSNAINIESNVIDKIDSTAFQSWINK
jgi:hypothetical protein